MEAYFDGLRVFQSPDNDIMVIRDERPVMHIACTKQLKKKELIQAVRELREMVIADRKARNRMNLYSAVCPICGKINQNLLLEEPKEPWSVTTAAASSTCSAWMTEKQYRY